jgi:hypothetical protein
MSQHIILDPGAPPAQALDSPTRAIDTLRGKVVGFVDNTKPNFDVLADEMASLLVSEHGAAGVVRHRKRAPSDGASASMLEDLREKCDLVIAGSGD